MQIFVRRFASSMAAVVAAGVLGVMVSARAAAPLSGADQELVQTAIALDRVPDIVRQQWGSDQQLDANPRFAAMAPEDRARLREIMARAFAPDDILRDVAKDVESAFDREKFERFVQAYSKPVVRRLGDMALAASLPQARDGLQAYMRELQTVAPPAERVEQLRRLDELTGSSELQAEFVVQTLGGMGGLAKNSPQYLDMVAQAREKVRQGMIIGRLYAYRSASLDELREFVQLHEDRAVAQVSNSIDRIDDARLPGGDAPLRPGDGRTRARASVRRPRVDTGTLKRRVARPARMLGRRV
jgi:hypothetical protein